MISLLHPARKSFLPATARFTEKEESDMFSSPAGKRSAGIITHKDQPHGTVHPL